MDAECHTSPERGRQKSPPFHLLIVDLQSLLPKVQEKITEPDTVKADTTVKDTTVKDSATKEDVKMSNE